MTLFPYGIPVTGNNFRGRQKLIEQLTSHFEDGQSIVIQGEPRIVEVE